MPRPAALLLALLSALLLGPAATSLEVPALTGRVVDGADLLSPGAEQRISAHLEGLEKRTGAQMAVLTVPGLGDEALEDYSLRVAESWRLGRAGVDDGVLLLIARDERRMRLEVGYGLEPRLTDLASRRILDEVVRPRFRAGHYEAGVEAGVEAVAAVVEQGDSALPPPEPGGGDGGGDDRLGSIGPILLLLTIVFASDSLARAMWTRGAAGWFLYGLLTIPAFTVPIAFLGLTGGVLTGLAWLLGIGGVRLWVARRGEPAWLARLRRKGESATSGRSGGWWGGVGGGGGSSGGGFTGGGGSFGGGGASGSW